MAPAAAPTAEGIWSGLPESLDLVTSSKEMDTGPAHATESCVSQHGSHHGRGAAPDLLKAGLGLRPATERGVLGG